MRHEISKAEAAQIQKGRAKRDAEAQAARKQAERDAKAAELEAWCSAMELKYKTQ